MPKAVRLKAKNGPRVSAFLLSVKVAGPSTLKNATSSVTKTRGSATRDHLAPIVHRIQNELFDLGAELACGDAETRARLPRIEARHAEALERDIDALNDQLPALRSFVLPGGGWVSSYLHLARTVCRRAERLVVALAGAGEDVGDHAVVYLNRLSDALFVFGRWAVMKDGHDEPLWKPQST